MWSWIKTVITRLLYCLYIWVAAVSLFASLKIIDPQLYFFWLLLFRSVHLTVFRIVENKVVIFLFLLPSIIWCQSPDCALSMTLYTSSVSGSRNDSQSVCWCFPRHCSSCSAGLQTSFLASTPLCMYALVPLCIFFPFVWMSSSHLDVNIWVNPFLKREDCLVNLNLRMSKMWLCDWAERKSEWRRSRNSYPLDDAERWAGRGI